MSSQMVETQSAEERFRKAFERLKSGEPSLLKPGTPVSQNNVAREAGCDPSAFKKKRFPALVREVQAYVELHPPQESKEQQIAKKKRSANRTTRERMEDAIRQRDFAQSTLASANMRIVELSQQVHSLQQKLDEISPPPRPIKSI